jgi:hypothetical protein
LTKNKQKGMIIFVKNIAIIFIILNLLSCKIKKQEQNINEQLNVYNNNNENLDISNNVDNEPVILVEDKWDFGNYINNTEELYIKRMDEGFFDTVIEKEFVHPVSNYKLYYTGENTQGEGQYWIWDNNDKEVILKAYFRYGPMIKWHGEYLVEINCSAANIGGAYFYDYKRKLVSDHYSFYFYLDLDKDTVICFDDGCLIMYNIFTNGQMAVFEFDEVPYEYFDEESRTKLNISRKPTLGEVENGDYNIVKPDQDTLVINYDIRGSKGNFVYEY